ncbi:MAG: hypothetical protein BWY99_01869 [Synergistetes bacterium ADurb.BinA166]|nr:MAG: hypothetical protein BWY99_01869 [Synergistetes bacterium ADurb.BinA166]
MKDTTAYKVVRQIVDHVHGPDEKVSDGEMIDIHRAFGQAGGSWEALMAGDMGSVEILEDVLDAFMQLRRAQKVASRVSAAWSPR